MTADSFTEKELDDIYAFAVQLGKDAGKLLLEAAQSRFDGAGQRTEELVEKDSSVDIVTKTDEGEQGRSTTMRSPNHPPQTADLFPDVEAFIKTSIAKQYPDHAYAKTPPLPPHSYLQLTNPSYQPYSFVGEENYSKSSARSYLISPTTPTWCVDPLDGTVNYTHLFPMFCVSIAFLVAGKPTIGVIYAPHTERQSHYSSAVLPEQFDGLIWFDETRHVGALEVHQPHVALEYDETWPFGL